MLSEQLNKRWPSRQVAVAIDEFISDESLEAAAHTAPEFAKTKQQLRAYLLTAGVMAFLAAAPANGAVADCRTLPYTSSYCFGLGNAHCRRLPAAACFNVRGTLGFGVGTPSVRLSPSGSRRVLGVFGGSGDPESFDLPRSVERLRARRRGEFLDEVRGDFRVCPLKTDRPGWMRPVCIVAASGLVATVTASPLPPGR